MLVGRGRHGELSPRAEGSRALRAQPCDRGVEDGVNLTACEVLSVGTSVEAVAGAASGQMGEVEPQVDRFVWSPGRGVNDSPRPWLLGIELRDRDPGDILAIPVTDHGWAYAGDLSRLYRAWTGQRVGQLDLTTPRSPRRRLASGPRSMTFTVYWSKGTDVGRWDRAPGNRP